MTSVDTFQYLPSTKEHQRKAAKIPEHEVHWTWLHGPVKPAISPRQAADRSARLAWSQKWALADRHG